MADYSEGGNQLGSSRIENKMKNRNKNFKNSRGPRNSHSFVFRALSKEIPSLKRVKKNLASKIVNIPKPLLAKNNFRKKEDTRKFSDRKNNDSTISHFGSDSNTLEANLNHISDDQIIKSVIFKDIPKAPSQNAEENKEEITTCEESKIQISNEEYQKRNPEIVFRNKIHELRLPKGSREGSPSYFTEENPSPQKYDGYMVNHYSIPNKLKVSFGGSKSKSFRQISTKEEHSNWKMSRGWMLKHGKRVSSMSKSFKTSLQNTVKGMKQRKKDFQGLRLQKHQRSNSDLESYPIEQSISFSEMKFPDQIGSARKFTNNRYNSGGSDLKFSGKLDPSSFRKSSSKNRKYETSARERKGIFPEKKSYIRNYAKIKPLNKTSLRKIKEILENQRRNQNTLLEQLTKDRNYVLNKHKRNQEDIYPLYEIPSRRMMENKSFSHFDEAKETGSNLACNYAHENSVFPPQN
ncbi:unnamed protein product [Moneuplotes crassus]|uniref:Uncharacterized protein n=1 Tax=Euplotes crassus TaxID=5936 RepID=A0AAD1U3V7_EUPCR|nr:unnamed protein product [Moneuplotes crassus]